MLKTNSKYFKKELKFLVTKDVDIFVAVDEKHENPLPREFKYIHQKLTLIEYTQE